MKNIKKIITDRFVEVVKKEKIMPWQKSWQGCEPKNLISKKAYRGFNRMFLSFAGSEYFLTYNQAKMLGGQVKQGSKGIPIIFYKTMAYKKKTQEGEETKTYPFLRYSTVFRVEDVEGIDGKVPAVQVNSEPRIEECEQFVNSLNVSIEIGDPCYIPSQDKVLMPEFEKFNGASEYYSVMFHELIHWTGSTLRLKRLEANFHFGDHAYSKEELVVEIGASFIRSYFNIVSEKVEENSENYVAGWLSRIEKDENLILEASSKAWKAFLYLADKAGITVEAEVEEEVAV